MKTHSDRTLACLAGALLAGACIACLGPSAPATAQEKTPDAKVPESPDAKVSPESPDPSPTQEKARRGLPLHESLPAISLGELTAEEGQVSIRRPIHQRHLQVIYVFSCPSVADDTLFERVMKSKRAGPRALLGHLQALSEVGTFRTRVIWSAVAVKEFPKSSSVPAGYAPTPQQGDESAEATRTPKEPASAVSVANARKRAVKTRALLRRLKANADAEFPLLLDPESRVAEALKLRFNCVLIVDAKGVIQFAATERHTMKFGSSRKNAVDSDYLRRALNELLDGRAQVSSPYGR